MLTNPVLSSLLCSFSPLVFSLSVLCLSSDSWCDLDVPIISVELDGRYRNSVDLLESEEEEESESTALWLPTILHSLPTAQVTLYCPCDPLHWPTDRIWSAGPDVFVFMYLQFFHVVYFLFALSEFLHFCLEVHVTCSKITQTHWNLIVSKPRLAFSNYTNSSWETHYSTIRLCVCVCVCVCVFDECERLRSDLAVVCSQICNRDHLLGAVHNMCLNLLFKSLGLVRFFIRFWVFSVHWGCIYLIKNTVKTVNIIKMQNSCFLCEYVLNCNLFLWSKLYFQHQSSVSHDLQKS